MKVVMEKKCMSILKTLIQLPGWVGLEPKIANGRLCPCLLLTAAKTGRTPALRYHRVLPSVFQMTVANCRNISL